MIHIPPAHNKSTWKKRPEEAHGQRFGDSIIYHDQWPQQAFETSFGFVGFCCDIGVQRNYGRKGASQGPHALRQHLQSLPAHQDIHIHDFGNITCQKDDLETSQSHLASTIKYLHQHNIHPIVIGGGHETAWGHFQGLQQAYPDEHIGIINFDAHFDLRPKIQGKGSSGTPFLQIADLLQEKGQPFSYMCLGIQETSNTAALFQTAEHHRVQYIRALDFPEIDFQQLERFIKECDKIYITVCLDVFNAAYAPGVSAPQPFGINPHDFLRTFLFILEKAPVIGFDIVELSPPHDKDHITAKLAAQIVSYYLHHCSLETLE